MSEVRPSAGQLLRRDGTSIPVRFIRTGEPMVFLAVDKDGDRVRLHRGDVLKVDVLAPGQSISIDGVNTWAAS